jgi:hypothetical protein
VLEADRDPLLRRFAARLREHRAREVHAGHTVPALRELERQEAGAAADVQGVE